MVLLIITLICPNQAVFSRKLHGKARQGKSKQGRNVEYMLEKVVRLGYEYSRVC